MSANTALIILSSIIVFSYIIEVISRKLKLPSVILLLITGIVAKVVIESYGVQFNYLDKILPILGTIGLILIVFEGSLELKYDKSKNKLILGAFLSAITILLFTVLSIGFILNYITYQPLHTCMINAVPFGVISSAVAIPSTYSFSTKYREFIIYESSFSDILGIIVFNFFIHNSSIESSSFLHLGLEIFLVLFISILFCFLLLFILRNLKLQVRFILIIAILFLIYAIGKHYHLSSLLIVLLFGLFLANIEKLNFSWIHRYFLYPNFLNDFNQLHQISLEAAFLIRTFFFIIFGLTINLTEITSLKIIEYGIVITISIFLIRLVYLKYVAKFPLSPLVYMSPRGLISILLFFSIPEQYKMCDIESGILFIVIFSTSIIMTFGVLTYRKSD
jgi:NhaP-type Na+/H+ or K+/H+ antiporter